VRGFGVAGKSLDAMLQAAQSSLLDGRDGPALNQLEAFVHHVGALAGTSLDPATASAVAEAAHRIALLLAG
jgi:hypothetical protein